MNSDLSIQEWLRKILLEWQMNPAQLASILTVDEPHLRRMLEKSEEFEAGTIPSGFDAAPALIRIHQLLCTQYQTSEGQLKWLFSEHPDFGKTKPIDVISSSRENLFWVAYYLESALNRKREGEHD